MTSRRDILKTSATLLAFSGFNTLAIGSPFWEKTLLPLHLRRGDKVALVNPAGATYETEDVKIATETLEALGLKVISSKHLLDRYGYLAGTDQSRADDINTMFGDKSVSGIIALRGGWGCNRILNKLDYKLIASNPKILMGYSDITSLLLAIYAKTGLVTFHGPVGISTWNNYSVQYLKDLIFNAKAIFMQNPTDIGDNLTQVDDRVQTITGGVTRGKLLGGNLSVLVSMIGSKYLPSFKKNILFIEEVGEDIYRIDRMITQLKLSGILDEISGFIFGKCTKCGPDESYGSLTLEELFKDHIKPLKIPSWYGAMIGHVSNKFTIPLGIEAEIDADKGTIQLLSSAVK